MTADIWDPPPCRCPAHRPDLKPAEQDSACKASHDLGGDGHGRNALVQPSFFEADVGGYDGCMM